VRSARELVRQALAGRGGDRPLFAPRACAIAGEIEGLSPPELLADPTKLANLLRELQRGSGLDVVWVASGSGIEHDPRRLDAALEAARRLRAVLSDGAALGWSLPGPATLAPDRLLPLVRACCEAAADVILLEESGPPPEDAAAYAAAARPLAATARFFQALPLLSTGWGAVPPGLGRAFVPCASDVGTAPPFALAVGLDAGSLDRMAGSDLSGCVLVTSSEEITGRMSLAAARDAMAGLRGRLGSSVLPGP
jgi:hypothetical protein